MFNKSANGEVCFCWNINYKCNYRCPYCYFFDRWGELKKLNTDFSAQDWIDAWNRVYDIYGQVRIETAGGEPFLFPSFAKCVKEICKVHTLRVTSNLSCSLEFLDSLIKENNPQKLKWNASFHPSFTELETFLEKALLLKKNKFDLLVMYVAYPPQIKQMEYYREVFQKEGIEFFIQAFQGQYKGIAYPDGYPREEKEKIHLLDSGREESRGGLKKLIENQLEKKKTIGKLCLAGKNYAFVESDGEVFRCSRERKPSMGNFLKRNFKLFDQPLPCELEFCPCEFIWLAEENQNNGENVSKKQQDSSVETKLISSEEPEKSFSKKESKIDAYPAPGRVFWCWDIDYNCNYKCAYCWLSKAHQKVAKDINPFPGIKKLLTFWEGIYKRYGRCHIHISGGEPSIYPSFTQLIVELSKMHALEFDTNLSFDAESFIKNVRNENIKIDASFHPEFTDFNTFFSKALKLKEGGFRIGTAYVGYPIFLERLKEYKESCNRNGMEFTIQAFRGNFNGKEYPLAYTDSEKKFIGLCAEGVTEKILKHHTEEGRKKEQKLCRMGQMCAKIYPSGDTYRCCIPDEDNKIGNIFSGNLELFNEARHCERAPCPCWRAMIAGKEDAWKHYWYMMK